MSNDSDKYLWTSKVAYRILWAVSKEEKYAKEIAEEIDSTRETVSNFIKKMRDAGMLKRGSRTQAQYYMVDMDGLVSLFHKKWDEIEDEFFSEYEGAVRDQVPILKVRARQMAGVEEWPDEKKEFKIPEDITEQFTDDFISYYISFYLNYNEESTIENMMVTDFLHALSVFSANRISGLEESRVESLIEFMPKPEHFDQETDLDIEIVKLYYLDKLLHLAYSMVKSSGRQGMREALDAVERGNTKVAELDFLETDQPGQNKKDEEN